MYLHVGNNQNVRIKDIVGIFDADTATVSAITKKYLSDADHKKIVKFASEEIPKSFVVYKNRKRIAIAFAFPSSPRHRFLEESEILGIFKHLLY